MSGPADDVRDRLVLAAREACRRAYAPYSRFPVGAALLGEDGEIYSGCNIENASFGLTLCAERAAVCQAVSRGCRRFEAVAIYTPTPELKSLCGACRQVLSEFSPRMRVFSACDGPGRNEALLCDLLPGAFDLRAGE